MLQLVLICLDLNFDKFEGVLKFVVNKSINTDIISLVDTMYQSKLKMNDSYDCCNSFSISNDYDDDGMIPLSYNLGVDYSKVLARYPKLNIYLNTEKINSYELKDHMDYSKKYYIICGISSKNTYYIYTLTQALDIYHINKNEWISGTIEN